MAIDFSWVFNTILSFTYGPTKNTSCRIYHTNDTVKNSQQKKEVTSVDLIPAHGHLNQLAMIRQPNSSASVSIH